MVIPMKKYTFLVYHRELDTFLEALRREGVVHIESEGGQPEGGALENIRRELAVTEKALRTLQALTPAADAGSERGDAARVLASLEAFTTARDRAQQEAAALVKEIALLEPWGEFDPAAFTRLAGQGVRVLFFTASLKKYAPSLTEDYPLAEVARDGKTVYLAGFFRTGSEVQIPELEEVTLPLASLQALRARLAVAEGEAAQARAALDKLAAWGIAPLQGRLEELEAAFAFERARLSGELSVEDMLVVLHGWVPKLRIAGLDAFLEKTGTVFLTSDPAEDEIPPVAVKNGFFSRLFEPIAKLFSLPAYHELDLTAAFAPFFTLFFGLCLGDAGYGLVIFIGAFIARFKVKREMKPLMTLAMVLAFSTMVVGAATGTVFGIWLSTVPAWKDKVLIPDSGMIFYMSLGIGVVQILFGMLIQIVNRFRAGGFLACLSRVGWFLMVASLVIIMIKGSVPGLAASPVAAVAGITIWIGIGLILLFNDLKANIFARIGKGIWELYGITGFFGDMLSYVRLFALGISSGILGLVINNIAGNFQAIPVVGPVIFVLVLLIGHTGNILLSGLGSFVHPMRLTFVEFYNNSGFEGGGREYRPLALKNSK